MARPKKEPEITYTHHINLRLTDVQYEIISENARRVELSLSEYIRRQLMKGKVIAKYELVADLPELKKLIFEFGKIGNNLNQIARHFNTGGIHSQEMRKAINQGIADIYEMKYEKTVPVSVSIKDSVPAAALYDSSYSKNAPDISMRTYKHPVYCSA